MKPESSSTAEISSLPSNPSLPVLLGYVTRCSWNAVRPMLLPAAIIQLIMLLLVVGYYLHWPTSRILEFVGSLRDRSAKLVPHGEMYFNFLSSGLACGVLAEVFKVYMVQRGHWTRANVQDAIFKFFIVGFGGLTAGLFYIVQSLLFGSHPSVQNVIAKVLFDQFVFSPLVSAPFPCIINHCLSRGLSLKSIGECLNVRFYIEKIFPLLFTTWCFWFPITCLIYSLPSVLQFPLFLLASTTWGLIFTALLNPDADRK